jgi:hypothetical protein
MSAQDVHRIPHEKKAYYRNKRRWEMQFLQIHPTKMN